MGNKSSLFQIVLLAGFAALAVAAVLIFSIATSSTAKGGIGPVVIWGTLDETSMDTVLHNAAEENPDLSQVTYIQKDASDYESDLANALAAGKGPDLFIISQDEAVLDSNKAVNIPYTQLSKSQFQNLFVQAADPFETPKGIIAIPFVADPMVLYWNRDILSSAGFAQPPKYWDELPKMAEVITDCSQAYLGQTPRQGCDSSRNISVGTIDMGQYENVDHAKDILSMLIFQAGGEITAFNQDGSFTSALTQNTTASGNPAQAALDFYTQFADPSKDYYAWNSALPDAEQAFAASDLAFYLGFSSEQPLIQEANPNLNFAPAGMPQIRGAAKAAGYASVDFGRVWGFAISRQSKNINGAYQAALLLASASTTRDFAKQLHMTSARLDVLGTPAQGDDAIFNQMALISRSWADPDPNKTDTVFQQMIEDTVSGAMRTSEAIQRADQQISQIIGVQ